MWQIALKFTHMSISFKTIPFSLFPAQWQDSSYSNCPHSTGPPRTSRQHSRSGRVMSPSHWKHPIFPKTDGMPASLVSWAPKASSDGSILRFPKMMTSRKSRKTYSQPLQIIWKSRRPIGITSMKCTATSDRVNKKPLTSSINASKC